MQEWIFREREKLLPTIKNNLTTGNLLKTRTILLIINIIILVIIGNI